MPFDPVNMDHFREILNQLRKDRSLTSQKAIDLVNDDRRNRLSSGEQHLQPLSLSRSTLDRFKKGEAGSVRNIDGFEELWRVLERHDAYAYAFQNQGLALAPVSPEEAMASALTRYFSESVNHPDQWFKMSRFRKRLVGRYIMYWPAWMPEAPPGSIITSLIEINDTENGLIISETQKFLEDKNRYGFSMYQKNSGFLFSFSKHIHFLMTEKDFGTTVRFGSTEKITEYSGNNPVRNFYGKIYSVSHSTNHSLTKFYCTRILDNEEFVSKIMNLCEIPIIEAEVYLKNVERLSLPFEITGPQEISAYLSQKEPR